MGMGFAPTWLRQVSPLLHKTTLTTDANSCYKPPSRERVHTRDTARRASSVAQKARRGEARRGRRDAARLTLWGLPQRRAAINATVIVYYYTGKD